MNLTNNQSTELKLAQNHLKTLESLVNEKNRQIVIQSSTIEKLSSSLECLEIELIKTTSLSNFRKKKLTNFKQN